MAYTKTNWNTGDTITAEKLNNLEDGVEAASSSSASTPLILELSNGSDGKWFTYNQLLEAYQNRRLIVLYAEQEGTSYVNIFYLGELSTYNVNEYSATFISGTNVNQTGNIVWLFIASDPDAPMSLPE